MRYTPKGTGVFSAHSARVTMGHPRKITQGKLEAVAEELVIELPGGTVRIITGPNAGNQAAPLFRVEVSANGNRYADEPPTFAKTVKDRTGSTTWVSAGRKRKGGLTMAFLLFDTVPEEGGRRLYMMRVRRPLYTPHKDRAHRFPTLQAAERVRATEGGFIVED